MDSFENMSYKFAEFWTPVREKNERVKLKVPKWDKARSRSDSNSPFPENFFDTQTRKFRNGSGENLFQRGGQEKVLRTSHSRTPLQILNTTVEFAKSSIEKVVPKVCISEHSSGTESTLNGHLRGDRTPVSSKSSYLRSASSSRVLKSTLINGPNGNKTNIRKQFIIYDENCTTPLKENNEENSPLINFTQDFHVVGNFSDEKSQKTMVFSSFQGREQKNLKSGFSTPRNTQSFGNMVSDRKRISSPLKAVGLKKLPQTEKIGSPFWGTDEGSIEDIPSLHDVIRSANIWDIQENFNFHCCTNGCENFFESSPEFQLIQGLPGVHMFQNVLRELMGLTGKFQLYTFTSTLKQSWGNFKSHNHCGIYLYHCETEQEPICQMDLEPPTIENFIPWNEI